MAYDQKFVFESMEDAQSIRKYLTAVMEGLGQGRLTLAAGEQEFALEPPELVTFTVRARKREGEGRLSLTISWRRPEMGESNAGETLSIKA